MEIRVPAQTVYEFASGNSSPEVVVVQTLLELTYPSGKLFEVFTDPISNEKKMQRFNPSGSEPL